MIRVRSKFATREYAVALQAGAMALLYAALWAPTAHAYPMYDDGAGRGCVQCHSGFQGGNGALHFQHRTQLGITTCNLCHPASGGSTPVRTYWSGPGGGFGCAGCHGQDYGETSPNSGQPKATAYGLRQFHVNQGVTTCGTSGCHKPGAQGHSNPFPALFGEDVAPPYYDPIFSGLTNSCSSEDMPLDADSVGLDNDGDGLPDWADTDCAAVTTTTTTTTRRRRRYSDAGLLRRVDCIAPRRGILIVNEKTAGKEKLKVSLSRLQAPVTSSQFGDPVTGTTSYMICIYDGANAAGRHVHGGARRGPVRQSLVLVHDVRQGIQVPGQERRCRRDPADQVEGRQSCERQGQGDGPGPRQEHRFDAAYRESRPRCGTRLVGPFSS